jgi:hypothetical protein
MKIEGGTLTMFGFGNKPKSLADQAKAASERLAKVNTDAFLRSQVASCNSEADRKERVIQRKSFECPGLVVTVPVAFVFHDDVIPISWVPSGLIGTCAEVALMQNGKKVKPLWDSVIIEESGNDLWELAPAIKLERGLIPIIGHNFQIRFMTDTGFTAFSNYFSINYHGKGGTNP